ncbi:MAG: PIG-L family deacetylase [Ruminococcus sp.]|nr:PIG-L family deacetylase [Ruminococcus sp.]
MIDLINGIHNRYLTKKLKSGVLSITVFAFIAFSVSLATSFFVFAKIALFVTIVIVYFLIGFFRVHIKHLNQYTDVECGKEPVFSKKKVMILVPHEDDDINLAGGIIEQYLKYGSDVYVVFATNGDGDKRYDMSQMGFVRMEEAIKALGMLGVPEKNIIFLGYGDGWDENGPHIYNACMDIVVKSNSGRTHTYGLETHYAYSNNQSYTYSHYYDDIKHLLLEFRPDVIFCVDYDTHPDHRALSMLFEKVMGDILKSTDYKPDVYKGFGYRTAWGSAPDFSESLNIKSTVNCPSKNDVELYSWDERVRFPVDINSLNRQLIDSKLYRALSMYASQNATDSSSRIINGDKVFWKRRTDSVLYDADVVVSSGDKDKLTDFMLLDCNNLIEHGDCPFDGVWCPDIDDREMSVNVTFEEKKYISHIALYDNPSPDDNIVNAIIVLDDGTVINTDKLNPFGQASVFSVDKQIHSFEVKIDEHEGNHFGLCEIEAFASEDNGDLEIYKITDDKDNFIYDYIIPVHGNQVLRIYSNGSKMVFDDLVLKCDNKRCTAQLCDEEIVVNCPKGQMCHLTLLSKDGCALDSVVIRNPRGFERYYMKNSAQYLTIHSYLNQSIRLIKKFCFNR